MEKEVDRVLALKGNQGTSCRMHAFGMTSDDVHDLPGELLLTARLGGAKLRLDAAMVTIAPLTVSRSSAPGSP